MARPPKSEIAPGVFLRGKVYWLRYTPRGGGDQVRIPLGTSDKMEAIRLADEKRGKPLPGKGRRKKWDSEVKNYIREGLATRQFRKNTTESLAFGAKAFGDWSGVTGTEEVTSELLQAFYDVHSGWRKPTKSERKPNFVNVATSQGYTSKLGTFLRRSGIVTKVNFRGMLASRREVVVAAEIIKKLIKECPRADLKFVLLAGFHAGMRKEEIIMSRPQWFLKDAGRVCIPEIQTIEGRHWEVKSKRPRKIPLTPDFIEFLEKEFLDWKQQTYMLHPDAQGLRYRWDFRRPFTEYMKQNKLWEEGGNENVSPHTMRHSYITHLAEAGYSVQQIAAWSGDRIKTLETNYLHVAAPQGAVDSLYSEKKPVTIEQIAQAIKGLEGQLDKSTSSSLQKLVQSSEKQDWDWTTEAPKGHVRLYSVEDTVSKLGVFRSLIEPPDVELEQKVSDEEWQDEWQEGKYSTVRARLEVLRRLGMIAET